MKVRDRVVSRSGTASLVGLSVVGVLQAAMAAEPADESLLQEVVVTAERRETSESTTAISMNVITADELASKRTQTIADLQQTTPNVTINQSGLFNSINIRGIGNSAIQPSITTGVAVFQDGLLNAETITLGGAFLDLGTVEVLRGPQGTFVGASSTGGAIRLNSVRPSLNGETRGYVEALVGNKSDVKVTGAVNLPISSTFAARIAFNMERRDSYFDNTYSSSINSGVQNPFTRQGSLDDRNARVTLLWQPNESFEAIWRSEANRVDHMGSPYQPNPRTFTNALGQQTHSRWWGYDDPTHDPGILYMNTAETQDIGIVERHSLELNYTFANQLVLRSLTGYVHNENQYIEDQDGSIANASITRNDVGPSNDYYSQEINLISPAGPFNWIVGASGFYRLTPVNLVGESNTCGIDPVNGAVTPCPLLPSAADSLVFVNANTTIRSGGLFGQVNWKFIDTLELTAGARMNYDRNFSSGQGKPDSVAVVIPAPAGIVPGTVPCPANIQAALQLRTLNPALESCLRIGQHVEFKDSIPTWKVGLNWTPTARDFVYLFWSRGYKAGGVDNQGQFDPEKVDDYELGWKGTFLDGHARLSLGAFWMDYSNIQQAAFKASTISAGTTVYNIGSSTIKGLEMEFNARAGGFGLNATAGYSKSNIGDARVIDRQSALDSAVRLPGSTQDLRQCEPGVTPATAPTPCVDWTPYYKSVSGLPNLYSPKLSYSASLDYEFPVTDGARLTPRIGVSHVDKQDTNLVRREDFYALPSHTVLNASLTYIRNDWLVQAYCNNCSDKTYIASVQSDAAWNNVLYGNPRSYGMRVRRDF